MGWIDFEVRLKKKSGNQVEFILAGNKVEFIFGGKFKSVQFLNKLICKIASTTSATHVAREVATTAASVASNAAASASAAASNGGASIAARTSVKPRQAKVTNNEKTLLLSSDDEFQ